MHDALNLLLPIGRSGFSITSTRRSARTKRSTFGAWRTLSRPHRHGKDVRVQRTSLAIHRRTGRIAASPWRIMQKRGYEALLIVWPPDHATPVHDHDGLWGIEFVLDGVLEVEAFDLSLQGHPRLVSRESTILGARRSRRILGCGLCTSLPQSFFESTDAFAAYLRGELNTYQSFHPHDEGHWISNTHHTVREPTLI